MYLDSKMTIYFLNYLKFNYLIFCYHNKIVHGSDSVPMLNTSIILRGKNAILI
jgi:hypothetical protein